MSNEQENALAIYQMLYKELDAEARRLTDARHAVMQKRAYYKVQIERMADEIQA